MKKIILWVLLAAVVVGAVIGVAVSFNNTNDPQQTETPTNATATGEETSVNDVIAYLKSIYKDEGAKTPIDYERYGIVRIAGVPYEVVWTADVSEDFIKVVVNDDGTVTIDVNEECEADTPYVLTATVTDENGNTASHSWNYILPEAVDMVAIVKAAYALAPGESLPYESTLRGKIISIKTPYSAEYKNITVVIEIEGAEDMPIECYRLKGEGVEDLQIGDIITVTGTLKNYNGTIEFDAGCILESVIIGERVQAPSDPKQIVDEAYALGANKSLPYEATLTGTIISVDQAYDEYYGNITVTIEIEGREGKPIKCYRMKGNGVDKIGVNDLITVRGYITNYVGSKGFSTIEFVAGCILEAWEDRVAPVAPSDPKAIVDAAYALGANETLRYEATLTGKITKVGTAYDANYGNITVTIVVEGRENKPIVCYRMKGSGVDKIDIGDIITVKGYITNYVGDKGYSTIEFTAGCQLVSWKEGVTVEAPTDQVQIVKDAYALAPGDTLEYKATLTGKVTKIKTPYDSGFKNITVIIQVAGAEDMPITCYRLKGAGVDKIVVGDTITVTGYITNYQHSSGDCEVEFTAGCTLSKLTHADGTVEDIVPEEPDTPIVSNALKTGDKVVIFAPAYNKALSADKVDAESFYNKGVDITVKDGVVSGYGDAETWTVTDNGDGTYSFSNGGKNIGLGAQYSSMNLGETNDDWQLICLGGSLYNVKNTGRGNFIEWYASKNNWSTYNSSYAATDDQFQLSFYIIGTGILEEEVEIPTPSDPTNPTEPETPPAGVVATLVETPQVGVAYKMAMNNGSILYFNGQTESASVTYRLATSVDATKAVDVYLEAVSGVNNGYRLYFMNGSTKTYIRVYHRTDGDPGFGKGSLELVTTAPTEYFTYDSTAKTLIYDYDGNNAYYMGTYSTFSTFSVSNTYYITGDKAANVDVSQFPARFYTVEITGDPVITDPTTPSTQPTAPSTQPTTPSTEPSVPAGTTVDLVEAPQAGVAYKMGMDKNDGNVLFFNGQTESETVTYRLATSVNPVEAADVYLEAVSGVNNGFRLYFMNGGTKTYIRVFHRTDGDPGFGKGSLEFVTTAPSEYFVYDSTAKTLIYDYDGNNAYYMGTYSAYTTFSVSNTSYITGDKAANVDVSQFPARFYAVEIGETEPTTPSTEPTAPSTEPTAPSTEPTTPSTEPTTPSTEPTTPSTEPVVPGDPEVVTDLQVGVAYKMAMDNGSVMFFNGQTESASVTYRLATSTDVADAVDVYLEAVEGVEGGYRLYFMNGETKTYIRVYERTDGEAGYGKGSLEMVTDVPAEYFTYDATAKTLFYTADADNAYYMGTYSTYSTFSVSNTFYITGDKAANVDVSQYPARFYAVQTNEPTEPSTEATEPSTEPTEATTEATTEPTTAPTVPAEPTIDLVEAPQAGIAYKMAMNNGAMLFFNGQTESESVTYRLATSTDSADAVDVYLEAVEGVEGGYRLYFMNGETKTYIRVYERTDGDAGYGKGSLEFVTSVPAEYFTYDATAKTLIYTADADNSYYMGTYSTFSTFSVSNTFYITGDKAANVDVSQYPARFYAVNAGEEPEPTTEATEPTTQPTQPAPTPGVVAEPQVGVAYKMTMNNGTLMFFNGQTESESVTYRLATSTVSADAVDVYLEAAEGVEGGYRLYFMNGGTKTYIRVYERTDGDAGYGKGSLEFVTDVPAEYFTYDATVKTLIYTADADNAYYMGTYSTFSTFSVSNTFYITGDKAANIDVSQYPARFYIVGNETPETTEPSTEATEPSTEATQPEESQPENTNNAQISFADVANRLSQTGDQQVWQQNGITVTNDKSASTNAIIDSSNPVRFYKNSKVTIAAEGMVKIVVNCDDYKDYATALVDSIPATEGVTVNKDGTVVTIEFATAVNSFVIEALSGGQVRVDSIVIYK